jgi:formamidopyrimidine-DNA glycosylase
MPELPEVETTRRGIAPHLIGRRIARTVVRDSRLRWPVPVAALAAAEGVAIEAVERRAKYLLVRTVAGTIMLHLGMSGSLRVIAASEPPFVHDHIDIVLDNGQCLRLRDPRRFGSVHWLPGPEPRHALLASLGPEPWDAAFTGDYLYQRARGRRRSVKAFLMDSHVVVGVGNIYANEALFAAGIHPARAAQRVGRARYARLAEEVCSILERAIEVGGTTLRDFTDSEGEPGYFRIELAVYGRTGECCLHCSAPLRTLRQDQRATWYCPRCQR